MSILAGGDAFAAIDGFLHALTLRRLRVEYRRGDDLVVLFKNCHPLVLPHLKHLICQMTGLRGV